MKKKYLSRRQHKSITAKRLKQPQEQYIVVVRSWMLVVMFALMLGVGAIIGNFFNQKLNETTPTVAGVEVEELETLEFR